MTDTPLQPPAILHRPWFFQHGLSHGPRLFMDRDGEHKVIFDFARRSALGPMDDALRCAWDQGLFTNTPLLTQRAPHTIRHECAALSSTLHPSPTSALSSCMRHALQKTSHRAAAPCAWTRIGDPTTPYPETLWRLTWTPTSHAYPSKIRLLLVQVGPNTEDIVASITKVLAAIPHSAPCIFDLTDIHAEQIESIRPILLETLSTYPPPSIHLVSQEVTGLGKAIHKGDFHEDIWVDQSIYRRSTLCAPSAPISRAHNLFSVSLEEADPYESIDTFTSTPEHCAVHFRETKVRDAFIEAAHDLHVHIYPAGLYSAHLDIPSNTHPGTLKRALQRLQRALLHPIRNAPKHTHTRRPRPPIQTRVRPAMPEEAEALVLDIMALEERIFEPARRDSAATLRKGFDPQHGVAIAAEALLGEENGQGGTWTLIGYALGAPATWFTHLDGPKQDPPSLLNVSLYSMAISIDPAYQGFGLGRRLKNAQIEQARALRTTEDTPRYRFVTGRNRVHHTDSMMRINRTLGGYTAAHFTHQYGDPTGEAIYYRIPLFETPPPTPPIAADIERSLSNLETPLHTPTPQFSRMYKEGHLTGPALYSTPLLTHPTRASHDALSALRSLLPKSPHLHPCASLQDALEFVHHCVHNASQHATSRIPAALPETWSASTTPLESHGIHMPTQTAFWEAQDMTQALVALQNLIPNPDAFSILWTEPVQRLTGRIMEKHHGKAVERWCAEHGVAWGVLERASALYRTHGEALASQELGWEPDALVWWGGGHMVCAHISARLDCAREPWMNRFAQGAEISLLRTHDILQVLGDDHARRARLSAVRVLEDFLAKHSAFLHHCQVSGRGLFRVFTPKTDEARVVLKRALKRHRLTCKTFDGPLHSTVFAPSLDCALEETNLFLNAARDILLIAHGPKVHS